MPDRGERKDPPPIDPRLTALVVVAVVGVFVMLAIVSAITGRPIDGQLYWLMGIVAGGVLGYGVIRKSQRERERDEDDRRR